MPPGTIAGVVTDAGNGDGIPSAYVSLVGQKRGTVTDLSGRFQFKFAPSDSFTLEARRIGYDGRAVRVRLDPARGYAVVLALPKHQNKFIDCLIPSALTVVARNVGSDRAPAGGATLWVSAPGYRDSVSIPPGTGDSLLILPVGPGLKSYVPEKYSIVVRSPCFRKWKADFPRAFFGCGGLSFSPLHVWLVPK